MFSYGILHTTHVVNDRKVDVQKPKFEALRPNFGWISVERIKKTLAAATQYARTFGRFLSGNTTRPRFPAAIGRFHDDVATDTFFQIPRQSMIPPWAWRLYYMAQFIAEESQ
jgi:hypothetical protein